MTTKPLLLCLFAALGFQGTTRACQYCALAANDPEMARLAAEMHAKSGGFPLDASLGKFQPAAPSAILTVPPPAANVATRAADLPPVAVARRPLPPPPSRAVVSGSGEADKRRTVSRWANGGLLGLFGLAGFFGWRTRRTAASGSPS